ncbi:hypothetical protein [Anaerocolumna xylanovorans]|uniref:HEAT repeat-containing protein n=1 Tax=Anaerocolumna xylanovorans DSM 12503 TaxID=1121345 RepID=A0A1M7XZS2_9FIRM|nr:hypothetical protein [Anaerocolumna xylanovorans]SHO44693.1 hypothetical protein SAMN02745217_00690 [Anaerocolumna xylanovorans DSM 12503]
MIEKLACKLERNDEIPNIELAELLCENNDTFGISEIAEGIRSKEQAISNDCIKVLYEIGARKPELIAGYALNFVDMLLSKNNRMVWGSMTALAEIADICADDIMKRIETVYQAYSVGSVITIDNSMTVFAKLCLADYRNQTKIFPILITHFQKCRVKEVPQHFERISICLNAHNSEEIIDVIKSRTNELSEAQLKRVNKTIRLIRYL